MIMFLIVGFSLSSLCLLEVSSQKKNSLRQPRKTAQRSGKVYNNFLHNISAHRESCNSCHKTPTGLSSAETLSGEDYKYPDITDYPEHESCVNCHRQQFFNGARPAICSICHTKVSPRDKVRFAFPKTNQAQEFSIRFPHNVHQDIIAGIENQPLRTKGIEAAHFANAKFAFSAKALDDGKTDYNNCTICHAPAAAKTYVTAPYRSRLVTLETGMVADAHREKIAAPIGYFKAVPEGHNSCFNCHYSEQQPIRTNCAGCHILQSKAFAESKIVERISLKFNHNQTTEGGTNPHDLECATCHVRITQSAELRTLSPDVPIFTCGGSCHGAKIKMEVGEREKDLEEKLKNPQYQIKSCEFCHSTFVGSYKIPKSHTDLK